MDHVPTEILRAIIREATAVTEAFDHPIDASTQDEERTMELIAQSMHTKTAISLVSKRFHQLGNEYLYQILSIRQQESIRPLVALLRYSDDDGVPHGWWCRRLVIDLRHWDTPWKWGNITLWGLLPCCPRLNDVRCIMHYSSPPGVRAGLTINQYLVSAPLLQTIATTQGSTLKYVHFALQVTIQFELALKFLSNLPALEVCRFDRLISRIPFPEDDSSPESESDPETDEDEDEDEHCETKEEEDEYERARQLAAWPTSLHTVNLPALRRLDLNTFVPDVGNWHVPRLRRIVAGIDIAYSTQACSVALQKGLGPHASHITHFTYHGGRSLDIWRIVGMLPVLEHLGFGLTCFSRDPPLGQPHLRLQFITLIRGTGSTEGERIVPVLDNIRIKVTAGHLPSLRCIYFDGYEVGGDHILTARGNFEGLGINLDVLENRDLNGPLDLSRYKSIPM